MRHGTCFRRRLSTRRAGAAPCSAVAELGVVRRFRANFMTDNEKIFELLELARNRVEDLEAQVLQQQAMIHGVLLCLRDASRSTPADLERAFRHYSAEVHQELLERLEDIDPWLATRLDKRPPESTN